MDRNGEPTLLLGEWACLGILYQGPAHGFAIAARLKPIGDVGRVWTVSRPLTYRAIEQLTGHGYVHAVGEEPGVAGGNRTIVAATRRGRARFRRWLATPVVHLRDLRSELLLKLVLADQCGLDPAPLLERQRDRVAQLAETLTADAGNTDSGNIESGNVDTVVGLDVVALWRAESAQAALRFLDRIVDETPHGTQRR